MRGMASHLSLSVADHLRLNTALVDLYALRDKASLVSHLLATLPSLIDADLFSYIEADPVDGRFAAVRTPVPDSEEMLDIFAPMAPDHPIIQHAVASATTAAFRVGDFVSSVAWREMPMYNEFMRPERIEHQLGVPLQVNPSIMTFVATHRSSGSDFSERDRAMLTLLAPHVTRAILNAELLSRLEHGGEVIEVSPSGRVRFTTALARKWLGDYFGPAASRADCVPMPLLEARRPGGSPTLSFAQGTRELCVRRVRRGDVLMLVLSEKKLVVPRLRLEELGLSAREIDVVTWLAHGKTNSQIAEILGISTWTVKKHLGRVFEKLGVDSRTAAALSIRELSGPARR